MIDLPRVNLKKKWLLTFVFIILLDIDGTTICQFSVSLVKEFGFQDMYNYLTTYYVVLTTVVPCSIYCTWRAGGALSATNLPSSFMQVPNTIFLFCLISIFEIGLQRSEIWADAINILLLFTCLTNLTRNMIATIRSMQVPNKLTIRYIMYLS